MCSFADDDHDIPGDFQIIADMQARVQYENRL